MKISEPKKLVRHFIVNLILWGIIFPLITTETPLTKKIFMCSAMVISMTIWNYFSMENDLISSIQKIYSKKKIKKEGK